jgi:hypothetical protein
MRIIIVVMALAVMACSLFFFQALVNSNSEKTLVAYSPTDSEKRLQLQVNDLSARVSNIGQLLSKIDPSGGQSATPDGGQPSTQDGSGASDVKDLSIEVDSLKAQIAALQDKLKSADTQNLAARFDSLNAQVTALADKLKTADTAIGNVSVTVNGLDILFITDSVELGMTGSTIPGAAQFALKITNATGSALNNIDVTGTITGSADYSEALASGYPQLVDGAGLCSYVFYITQGKTLHFEAFGNAKGSLSIPPGGSITLRPKISILAGTKGSIPGMTFSISLETISFDRAAK